MPGIVLALLAAVLDLLAAAFGLDALRVVTKPLPALILAAVAWSTRRPAPRILSVGLILAAGGDEFLLGTGPSAFLSGMLAFAAMHVAYIVAFFKAGAKFSKRPKTPQAMFELGYLVVLVEALRSVSARAGDFAGPVRIYGLLLSAMALTALRVSVITGIGATLFVCSDMLLAFAKFTPSFPLPSRLTELVVIATYFGAQILIVRGVIDATSQDVEHDRALTTA